jgi:hypothetical protein
MSIEQRMARAELYPTGTLYKPPELLNRNLGSAIFLAAIEDYRGMCDELHESAGRFLYPRTAAWQARYDWAVSLAEGLDPTWLRDALDRLRDRWDGQRLARILDDTVAAEMCAEEEGDHL